jgi:hypothetical protein
MTIKIIPLVSGEINNGFELIFTHPESKAIHRIRNTGARTKEEMLTHCEEFLKRVGWKPEMTEVTEH